MILVLAAREGLVNGTELGDFNELSLWRFSQRSMYSRTHTRGHTFTDTYRHFHLELGE